MLSTTTIQAHIAYELIDDRDPDVVVVEFLSHEIAGLSQARELREQLDSLVRPDLPQRFVIDFGKVRSLGSTAFGEIVSFARKVGRLAVCNMDQNLRIGADLIGLDVYADFAANRRAAIDGARGGAFLRDEDTVDYPARPPEPTLIDEQISLSGRSRTWDSNRTAGAARATDEEAATEQEARNVATRSPKSNVARAAELTLDDFGGRSDAPGG